jgi:DNA-binding IclR family transcriptional regulator
MSDRQLQQGIQSIEVGARVLFALEQGQGPLPLSEIARRSDMPAAKAHRYLVSLVRAGLASRDGASGLYDLGPAVRHLGVEALRRSDPVSTASAYAVELRDATGHTVNVAVWSEEGPIIVRWDTGTHVLPITVRVGSVLPLVESAIGQVFLAHLPAATTSSTLERQRGTTRRISERERRELVARVLDDGYGRTTNRMIIGEGALAAPVFGADGVLELVLGMAMPAALMTADAVDHFAPLLCATAARASRELGLRAA